MPVTMAMTMAVAVTMMIVMVIVMVMGCWSWGWVVMVMFLVVVVVIIFIFLDGMLVVPVTVSVPTFHFFQETDGIQEGHPESKKDELGQTKSERGLVVQNVWDNVDSGQIHEATRRDEHNRISSHLFGQQSHRSTNHGRKGRPKLRRDGLLFAKSALDQHGKVSQLVGYFVKQNGKRRQTTPGFHYVPDTRGSFKTRKGSTEGQAIRELQRARWFQERKNNTILSASAGSEQSSITQFIDEKSGSLFDHVASIIQ